MSYLKNNNHEKRLSSKDDGFFVLYNKILKEIEKNLQDPQFLHNIQMQIVNNPNSKKLIKKITTN